MDLWVRQDVEAEESTGEKHISVFPTPPSKDRASIHRECHIQGHQWRAGRCWDVRYNRQVLRRLCGKYRIDVCFRAMTTTHTLSLMHIFRFSQSSLSTGRPSPWSWSITYSPDNRTHQRASFCSSALSVVGHTHNEIILRLQTCFSIKSRSIDFLTYRAKRFCVFFYEK